MGLKKPSELFTKKNLNEDYSPGLNYTTTPQSTSFSSTEEEKEFSTSVFGLLDDYKKNINILERINSLSDNIRKVSEEVAHKLTRDDLENAMLSQLMLLDDNFKHIQTQIKGLNKSDLQEFKSNARELKEVVGNLVEDEFPKYKKLASTAELRVEQKFDNFESNFSNKISSINEELTSKIETSIIELNDYLQNLDVDNRIKEHSEEINTLKKSTKSLKEATDAVEIYISNHHEDVIKLREELLNEISNIPLETLNERINLIQEKYDEVKESLEERLKLNEGLLNEPSDSKNSDPLTPLDKNFVTLEQLSDHYRLFINRIQQQLSTIGGGGETRLKYLDDIVGIATNASAYDGKFLRYNHGIGKFQFSDVSSDDDSWVDNSYGTYTNANVGINTSQPAFNLDVDGDINFTGTFYQNGSPFVASRWAAGTGDNIYRLTGNVGIATNNPTSTLTVAGDIEAINANFIGSIDQLSSPVVNISSEIDATSRNYGILGVGTTIGFLDTGILAHFSGDSDQYCQVIVQNHNPGSDASADFIVNNSQELGLNHYVDLGINSPNYVGADDLSDPNGGYVYNTGGTLTVGTADPFDLKFVYESFEVARVSQNGIGIGTTVVTSALTLSGDALIVGVVTATDFNSASDIKLKENISVIENPLDKLIQIDGVNFRWKETGRNSLGVIAQEVEKVLPELVSGEDSKTVNYNGLVGLLIECVKQQQEEINQLKKLIDK